MIKVLLKGPILTQSGYGHHARTVLRALQTKSDVYDVYIQPITWGHTSWVWEDNEERRTIDNLLKKTIAHTQSGGTFDMSIQVSIPNEWEKITPINIGVTAGIETTKVSPKWIEKSFLMDKIITISTHSKNVFDNTVYVARDEQGNESEFKVKEPIEYVSYPYRKFEKEELDLELTTDFNFLAVAQLSARKNMDQLIRVFIEKFRENENVGLVIKANTAKNSLIDRNHTLNNFKNIFSSHKPYKCKVYLLHGYLSDQEMVGLYTHPKIKAMISTTHGEGFGLPLFEAACHGLPVAATDWSGHLDFLYMPQKQKSGKYKKKHMFGKINYTIRPVQEQAVWAGVLEKESMWAFPEDASIRMNLSKLHEDSQHYKKRAKTLQKWIHKNFSEEKKYAEYVSLLEEFTLPFQEADQEIEDLFNEIAAGE
tara:strand:+ start:5506 stop:6777 length:1272 start_codon:yes stop_codon:yes gene_type:complete